MTNIGEIKRNSWKKIFRKIFNKCKRENCFQNTEKIYKIFKNLQNFQKFWEISENFFSLFVNWPLYLTFLMLQKCLLFLLYSIYFFTSYFTPCYSERKINAKNFVNSTKIYSIFIFFRRREALKQTIAGERMNKEKSRKAGTFLCAKKNLKKKRKKSPYHSYQDGGYPLYSSSSTDGNYGLESSVVKGVGQNFRRSFQNGKLWLKIWMKKQNNIPLWYKKNYHPSFNFFKNCQFFMEQKLYFGYALAEVSLLLGPLFPRSSPIFTHLEKKAFLTIFACIFL